MVRKKGHKLNAGLFRDDSTTASEYFWLFSVSFGVSLLGMVFTQSEDIGVFITVSSLIGKGYSLYADIFDIKDPLFFYSLALVQKLFGITGLFIFDSLVTAFTFPIAFAIGIKLGINRISSFFSATLFFLILTGTFGGSLRSQILGIVFFLLLTLMLIERKWFSVGVYLILIFFTKMPMVIVALSVIAPFLFLSLKIQFLSRFCAGILTTTAFITLILQIRGELEGYIEMVIENFTYAANYQLIVGQRQGILGHFEIWNGTENRFVSFLFALIVILALRGGIRPKNFELLSLCLGVNVGVSIYLLTTAMWPHHLQLISLYIFFDFMFLLAVLNPVDSKMLQKSSKFVKLPNNILDKLNVRACITLFALIALISNSGWVLPLKPEMPIASYFKHSWAKPVEISMLEKARENLPLGGSFARLGMNDDMGFGAFLESDWQFKCSRFMMGGSESVKTIDKYLNCIREVPDVIITAPFYQSQKNRPGNYRFFYVRSERILSELFTCTPGPTEGYTYCLRKIATKN